MKRKSLLFISDISGFTEFIERTEVDHSQHVIAELLEILIESNTIGLELAEIEGDALFFYKEEMIPSQELLLAQITAMFTAFYSHLELLKKNRICPCNACAEAPNLQLKIIAHCGDLEHIVVNGKRKPFGRRVIEAHRLLKNSIDGGSYALITKKLASEIDLSFYYFSKIFRFKEGIEQFDGKEVEYIYSFISVDKLDLVPISNPQKVSFEKKPQLLFSRSFPIAAPLLLEYFSNYSNRHKWFPGVDRFEYNENEVTRVGTEHLCIIDGKAFDFSTVTKEVSPGHLVYGEVTSSPSPVDKLYKFYIIAPISETSCRLNVEVYWEAKSLFKKILIALFAKRFFTSSTLVSIDNLYDLLIEKAMTDP